MIDEIVSVTARDGTPIGLRIYRPDGASAVPALFGASPYRFDNNVLPASPQFLWRETGPIEFYVENGYAYVHMDVRGSGRSGGEFEFLGSKEQHDLYDAIEWVGAQDWCTGKVGGIGQSYFCMLQWFMAAQAPPSLACIGAHDGLADALNSATLRDPLSRLPRRSTIPIRDAWRVPRRKVSATSNGSKRRCPPR